MKASKPCQKRHLAKAVTIMVAMGVASPALADGNDTADTDRAIEPLVLTYTPLSANPFTPQADDRLDTPSAHTDWEDTLRRHDARFAASLAGWTNQSGSASYSGNHYGPMTVEPVPVAPGDKPPLDQWYYPVD